MLSKKELLKYDKELVELHKRCITSYLVQRSIKLRTRKKLFKLYDIYINETNIREYFFRDLDVFINALVTDRLGNIRNYFTDLKKQKKKNVHRKRK